MAREKVADPAFQKLIAEANEKENKIRKKWHLDVIVGLPHTAKVNWDEDYKSDEDYNSRDEQTSSKNTVSRKEYLDDGDISSSGDLKKDKRMTQSKVSERSIDTRQLNGTDLKVQNVAEISKDTQQLNGTNLKVQNSEEGSKVNPDINGKSPKDLELHSTQSRYIFPVCDYCDFGWRFDSNKYIYCPRHGPRREW